MQLWVALPDDREEMDPGFWHYFSDALPVVHEGCVTGRGWTGKWWAQQDSNLQPKDYESSALTIEL